ncbi:MFS transporter [Paenibacillus sp. N1-5-1-14]|uniref:MFS transporter n=1 Tax=Paenibacillus radicibacter TaxID=2972488 RepID=UPI0021594DFF|nr:MFS transporter [Paenibacillus radicibacter]MCR8642681.1 MFS transporter [Paenibacillus radicibacter]
MSVSQNKEKTGFKMSRTQLLGLCLVIAILFIDMLLYSIVIPIIPHFEKMLSPSATMLGVLFASYAVALFLATPFFGPLCDKIGRRTPIIIGLIGMAISTIMFAYAETMLMLIVARFVQGIAAAATWTAALAFLADIFPGTMRGTAMGMALTGISTGSLMGAPLGGWLFEYGGTKLPFFFTGGLTLLTALLVVFFMKEPLREKEESMGTFHLLRNKSVVFIACVILLAEISMTLLEPVLPVFLDAKFEFSPAMIGFVFGAMTLTYGLSAPIAGTLAGKRNPFIIMLIGIGCLALSLPLLVFSSTLWQVLASAAVVGALIGFTLSPTLATLGILVDQDEQGGYGAAYALFNMFHAVGIILGPLIGGVLTDFMEVPTAVIAVSTAILIVVAILSAVLKWKLPKWQGVR